MKLRDMYMRNFKFHKKNETMTDIREEKMITEMDELFEIIEDRTMHKKHARDDSSSSNINTVS